VAPVTYSISGNISGATSVTINLGGAATASAITDGSGSYSFTGLANGSYTLTPSKAGFNFSQASTTVTLNGANIIVPNFTATAKNTSKLLGGAIQGNPLNLTTVVSTLAGSGTIGAIDGTGTAASFYNPFGLTTDGTNLYVADYANHKIRKIQ
jgi:hypothetical protein